MSLKSLIFDFDGLILDTETPEFLVWQAIYRENGHELPAEEWLKIVGGYGRSDFDAAEHLDRLTGGVLDITALRERHRFESDRMTAAQSVLPGVTALLDAGRRAGLKLAIASSSPHSWVDSHLSRLGLLESFDPIVCADQVPHGRTKPHPDLFLKALELLQHGPEEAIAFEDSVNGVRSARQAGLFVVAVPNQVTALQGVDGANLTVKSLEEFHLEGFL